MISLIHLYYISDESTVLPQSELLMDGERVYCHHDDRCLINMVTGMFVTYNMVIWKLVVTHSVNNEVFCMAFNQIIANIPPEWAVRIDTICPQFIQLPEAGDKDGVPWIWLLFNQSGVLSEMNCSHYISWHYCVSYFHINLKILDPLQTLSSSCLFGLFFNKFEANAKTYLYFNKQLFLYN